MTTPMTRERLELFRKLHAEEQAEERAEPTIDWKDDAVGELLAEVDRLERARVASHRGEPDHWWRSDDGVTFYRVPMNESSCDGPDPECP
jgi:hypothetical protein